ncbi:hypothetical protein AGMMS49991_00640 [Spirochaetia bacterium]|nr:hypothetical protein AGMMS49991_00640 [Spirochaetia bacterium]
MEKPGMGRRYRCLRAGLLTFLLSIALPFQGARAAGDDNMALSLQTSPDFPEAGMPWTITILADHSLPGEVQILSPEFPAALTLEQVRTLPWVTETGDRWTAIEYRFVPRWGGTLFIGSFEVLAPEKRAFTPALVIEVQGTPGQTGVPIPPSPPRLSWAVPSVHLRTGEAVEFRLLAMAAAGSGTAPANITAASAASTYRPLPPENAIFEVLPPDPVDRRSDGVQVLLRLRVIPLSDSRLTIKPAELTLDGRTIPVPGLEIPVLPAAALSSVLRVSSVIPAPEAVNSVPASNPEVLPGTLPPFPDPNPGNVFYPFRPAYEKAFNTAAALWSTGQAAYALALLRQSERALLSGPVLAVTRRAAESLLKLGPTPDEPWRPRTLCLAGSIFTALILIVLLLRLKFRHTVTTGILWGFRIVIAGLILLTSLGFYGFIEGSPQVRPDRSQALRYRPAKGRAVVLKAGDAYRVPDIGVVDQVSTDIRSTDRRSEDRRSTDRKSEEARFREGEPARIREAAENWVYVETPEGKAGWTPVDRVIVY